MNTHSIRFKSSILYSSYLLLILLVFSSGVVFTVRHILYTNLNEELKIKALEVAANVNSFSDFSFFPSYMDNIRRLKAKNLNLQKDYIKVMNYRGKTIIHSKNFTKEMALSFKKSIPFKLNKTFMKNVSKRGHNLRIISMPIKNSILPTYIIHVGTSLERVNKTLYQFLFYLIINIILILLLTSFLGYYFTKKILKPVTEVTKIANNISYKNLHTRITESREDDEMKFLIDSFNSMINRLEKSFTHINEFSGNVAHELRTPLAVIKGEIEVLSNKKHKIKDYQKVMQSTLEEIDRMNRIIKDILLLAKLEYDHRIFKFENMNLSNFLKDISEDCKILSREKSIHTELKLPKTAIYIQGDKLHLRRLVFNLIHNALKYTPRKGKILISMKKSSRYAHINISDSGKGISEKDKNKIFNKFFRAESPNSEQSSGLGLNIAKSIAQAHQGDITVKSTPKKGATFTVKLQLS